MSVAAPIEELITDIEILADEPYHLACCLVNNFFCGRQYHPELEAREEHPLEAVCADCRKVMRRMKCPPFRPTHLHCPFMQGHHGLCPDNPQGRKV